MALVSEEAEGGLLRRGSLKFSEFEGDHACVILTLERLGKFAFYKCGSVNDRKLASDEQMPCQAAWAEMHPAGMGSCSPWRAGAGRHFAKEHRDMADCAPEGAAASWKKQVSSRGRDCIFPE